MSKYVDGSLIVEIDADLKKFNTSLNKVKTIGTVALAALTTSVVALSGAVVSAGVAFESSFAGVRKTVEATDAEFEELKKGILDLSTVIPVTANEIASIAEAAGQLGVKTENIMEFTKTMADLGASTNLSSTEAATALARLANVMQTDQSKFDNMGSAIVALGNNLATTESEIVDMAQNIAGAGKQVGMTEAQVLALSGALSSVGIEAAAGGTSISTLLIKMKKATVEGGKDLSQFANVANMTAAEFKGAFEKDAGSAIQLFVEGLGSASERGVDAIALLNDAGLTDVRMTRALLNAANASDVFSDAFEIASTAWAENTALAKEASQRYETAESKIQILKNSLEAAGITAYEKFEEPFKGALDAAIESVGLLTEELTSGKLGDSVDSIAGAFGDLITVVVQVATKSLPPLLNSFAWLLNNAGPIAAGIIGFNVALKGTGVALKLINTFQMFNVQMSLAKNTSNLAGIALTTYTAKTKLATTATSLFNKVSAGANALLGVSSGGLAMLAGVVVVGALAALTVGFMKSTKASHEAKFHTEKFNKALKESKEAAEENREAISDMYTEYEGQIRMTESYAKKVDALVDSNGNLIGTKEELNNALSLLNQSLGEEVYWYDEATGKIMDQNGAVQDLTTSMGNLMTMKRAQAYIDANQANLENIYSQIADNKQNVVDITNANKELSTSFDKEFEHMGMTLEEFNEKINSLGDDYRARGDLFSLAGGKDMQEKLAELSGHYSGNITKVEEYKNMIGDLNGQLEDYENMLLALETNNIELANDILNGFKFDVEGLGLEELETAYDSATQKLKDYYAAQRESGIDFSEEIKETTKELGVLKEKIDALSEMDESKVESDTAFWGMRMGDGIGTGAKEALGPRITEMTEDTQNQLNDANLVLPVRVQFQIPKFPYIGTSNVNEPGASFSDFRSPYSSIVSSGMASPADVFNNIIGSITKGIAGVNVNVAGSSGGTNTVNQNVTFNQQIENPSDITRAMRKMAREMKKVR